MNAGDIMGIIGIVLMIIAGGLILFAFISTIQLNSALQNLCEDNDGSFQSYGNICLIEEDGRIVEYKMLEFKDEWRLVK